jgi:hypothetical protein
MPKVAMIHRDILPITSFEPRAKVEAENCCEAFATLIFLTIATALLDEHLMLLCLKSPNSIWKLNVLIVDVYSLSAELASVQKNV